MNNVTQVKRGSTASWSLGPELVHWENLDVWGKDSLIRCEGTDLEMNVYTSSANYFYDENGQLEKVKRPGLWLIQPGEIGWDTSAQVKFKCWTDGPSDCWLEVAAPNASSVHGQRIPLGQQAQMTVPYIGEWGLYIRWPEQRENIGTADIKISIREVEAYEELAPGQLGVEYTKDGQVKLKAGMPDVSKWNELPYINNNESPLTVLFNGTEEEILNEELGYLQNVFSNFEITHTPDECQQALLQGKNVIVWGTTNTGMYFGHMYYFKTDYDSLLVLTCTGATNDGLPKQITLTGYGAEWDYQGAYIQTLLPAVVVGLIDDQLQTFDRRISNLEQQLNIQ